MNAIEIKAECELVIIVVLYSKSAITGQLILYIRTLGLRLWHIEKYLDLNVSEYIVYVNYWHFP